MPAVGGLSLIHILTINQLDKSTSISTQMDSLIPASKISNLTQGMFVGAVADNFDQRIEQKIFLCEIVVDNEKVKQETARYVKLPQIIDFTDKDGDDRITFDFQNAQGDSATCATITNGFVSAGVDLIMANATPALQAAQSATNEATGRNPGKSRIFPA